MTTTTVTETATDLQSAKRARRIELSIIIPALVVSVVWLVILAVGNVSTLDAALLVGLGALLPVPFVGVVGAIATAFAHSRTGATSDDLPGHQGPSLWVQVMLLVAGPCMIFAWMLAAAGMLGAAG